MSKAGVFGSRIFFHGIDSVRFQQGPFRDQIFLLDCFPSPENHARDDRVGAETRECGY
jgi:hypothetical protein